MQDMIHDSTIINTLRDNHPTIHLHRAKCRDGVFIHSIVVSLLQKIKTTLCKQTIFGASL